MTLWLVHALNVPDPCPPERWKDSWCSNLHAENIRNNILRIGNPFEILTLRWWLKKWSYIWPHLKRWRKKGTNPTMRHTVDLWSKSPISPIIQLPCVTFLLLNHLSSLPCCWLKLLFTLFPIPLRPISLPNPLGLHSHTQTILPCTHNWRVPVVQPSHSLDLCYKKLHATRKNMVTCYERLI